MRADQSDQPERCRLYWDYYGPSAQGTAQHFLVHLQAWLQKEGMHEQADELGVHTLSTHHSLVICSLPLEMGRLAYKVLKANRAVAIETQTTED